MAMSPWIAQQASDARIDDLRRVAAIDRLAQEIGSSGRRFREHPGAARVAGELLVRAGRRLAGEH